MNINNGGSAFPIPEVVMENRDGGQSTYKVDAQGMSLRDYMATAALQGFCANPDLCKHADLLGKTPAEVRAAFAKSAYAQADAMLAAREAKP